ncbi:MAG: MFS transporter [Chloroflexi bacterium]|nr:MFS transporter [Chloroflexota bacterium]
MNKASLYLDKGRELAVRWIAPGKVSAHMNNWNLYREIAWYGVLSSVTTTFAGVFALRLGASTFLIGLLTSLPALVNVLFQIPAARLVEREADRRKVLLWSGLGMRLPALLIALVPILFKQWQPQAVIYITALGTIPAAVGNVSFTAMLADVVAPQYRARVVSVRNVLLSVATTMTVLVTGKALDILPFPLGYQIVFGVAFLASLVSLFYLGRVCIPTAPVAQQSEVGQDQPANMRAHIQTMLRQRGYVRFVLGAFIYYWGLYFPMPLYAIYRVRVLRISDGWIGTLSMVESLVTILAYYAWGKIAYKRGSRFVLLSGALLVCIYPFATALSRSVWPLFLAVSIAGVAGPAFNMGLFNNLLEVAPAERRATYVAMFNTLINLAAFVSPLLGTTAAEWLGIREALFVGGIARVVGFVALARLLS